MDCKQALHLQAGFHGSVHLQTVISSNSRPLTTHLHPVPSIGAPSRFQSLPRVPFIPVVSSSFQSFEFEIMNMDYKFEYLPI
ncbi:hypothetical protein Lal_00045161 [Lupinus albus]|nr:hypothetical protein Lal_00045161 [Lupinus albus]